MVHVFEKAIHSLKDEPNGKDIRNIGLVGRANSSLREPGFSSAGRIFIACKRRSTVPLVLALRKAFKCLKGISVSQTFEASRPIKSGWLRGNEYFKFVDSIRSSVDAFNLYKT